LKNSPSNRTPERVSPAAPGSVNRAAKTQPSKESRNKANTIRNSVKVEHYLMQIEKVQGFARAWALRERLEQGQISFDELQRR
jgi:hypothetical protein